MLRVPTRIGETTITGKNQISLPAKALRELGWERGDRLIVEAMGDNTIVLTRRPNNWVKAFAGKLDHVFGTPEDALRYLEEERRSWDED